MVFSFNTYSIDENIPVNDYIKNKKMAKYYNRETQAAFVSFGKVFKESKIDRDTPIYYATGVVEHELFDLNKIAINSVDDNEHFSNQLFIEKGMQQVSPLTQFKILYNMTLCFISIEYGLNGDNAAIYASASGLLNNAKYSNNKDQVIIGAGKVYSNGTVESGFAVISANELDQLPFINPDDEAIEIFKFLKAIK
jgi:hypothetical protein